MQLSEFVSTYQNSINDGEHKEDITVSIAGRITSVRQQGKLVFLDITGDGAKVQLMSDAKTYANQDEEGWTRIISVLRRGDVVSYFIFLKNICKITHLLFSLFLAVFCTYVKSFFSFFKLF
jgi:lysyl-tRNA synthetase class II